MKNVDFVAIDIEKLDDSPLSVCEIGMVKVIEGKCTEYHTYINPKAGLSRNLFGETKLKHISDSVLKSSPTFKDVYSDMKEFIGGLLLVCHNKGADLNYIYYNEQADGLKGLYNKFIDTYDITHQGLEMSYKTVLGKSLPNHHHSLEDARHTAELFIHIQAGTDVSQHIKSDYIPSKEKSHSGITKYQIVPIEGLNFEDDLLADYSFYGKTCVISGESAYRDTIKKRLEDIGAKITGSISGKTNALIVGEGVGPSKKEKAIKQKANNPEHFHIFSQHAVADMLGIS